MLSGGEEADRRDELLDLNISQFSQFSQFRILSSCHLLSDAF